MKKRFFSLELKSDKDDWNSDKRFCVVIKGITYPSF